MPNRSCQQAVTCSSIASRYTQGEARCKRTGSIYSTSSGRLNQPMVEILTNNGDCHGNLLNFNRVQSGTHTET